MIEFNLYSPNNIRDIITNNYKFTVNITHTILSLEDDPNVDNSIMEPEDAVIGLDYYNGIIVNRTSCKKEIESCSSTYKRMKNIFNKMVPTHNVLIIDRYNNEKVNEILYVINYFASNSIILLIPNENMPLGKIVNKKLKVMDTEFKVVTLGNDYYYLVCNKISIEWFEKLGSWYTHTNYSYDGKGKDQSCELTTSIYYIDYRDKDNQLSDAFCNDIEINSYGRNLEIALINHFAMIKELKRIIDIHYDNYINGRIKVIDTQNNNCELQEERYTDYYSGIQSNIPNVDKTINSAVNVFNEIIRDTEA